MKNGIKLLNVSLNDRKVGRLAIENQRKCLFEYDPEWLNSGYSISPFYLPLKSGVFTAEPNPFDGLFGVFADSMPDGWGNLLLDRFLINQGISLSSLNALDRLAFVGKNGMGALNYMPDNSFVYKNKTPDLEELAVQVAEILSEQANIPTIKNLLELTGSSGGARPKVLIKHDSVSWMVKFPAKEDSRDIGHQEYFYSQLAKKCGIEMPETRLFENKYFGTRLFDRDSKQRYHVHSAGGLLHASHRYPSLDYKQLAQATLALTKSIKEQGRLLRQMVFNVIIENKDDHAKNFSYLYKNNEWKLSPAYDIVKSNGFGGEHATALAGSGNPTRKEMINLSKEIGFPLKEMQDIIDNVFDICLKSKIGAELRKRKL